MASAPATERFRQRFTACHPGHFRLLQDLWASSVGLGTYLGGADDATDALYAEALRAALAGGCNVLDSAINYRCQRSERVIGSTLASLIAAGGLSRDEVILCTKGGYLPFDGAPPADPLSYFRDTIIHTGLARQEDIVAGCHCLAPAYLAHALQTSLANLQADTIDVYYLHNPEQQLDEVPRETFLQRMDEAFAQLERAAHEGRIRYYGIATWNGLRCAPNAAGYLSLAELVQLAERAGGGAHHFKAIQLPYNLAMPEAYAFRNQRVDGRDLTLLEAAGHFGMSVMASASLLQSRLARLPAALAEKLPGPATPPQQAIQFVRSTPGITSALVGMKQAAHVEENLALASQPPLPEDAIAALFDRTRR
jgi:aryl-alcohol dehydrogenase-like predicted oxidoreductase